MNQTRISGSVESGSFQSSYEVLQLHKQTGVVLLKEFFAVSFVTHTAISFCLSSVSVSFSGRVTLDVSCFGSPYR